MEPDRGKSSWITTPCRVACKLGAGALRLPRLTADYPVWHLILSHSSHVVLLESEENSRVLR